MAKLQIYVMNKSDMLKMDLDSFPMSNIFLKAITGSHAWYWVSQMFSAAAQARLISSICIKECSGMIVLVQWVLCECSAYGPSLVQPITVNSLQYCQQLQVTVFMWNGLNIVRCIAQCPPRCSILLASPTTNSD